MKTSPSPLPITSAEVRNRIEEALRLDLVGPWPGSDFENEMLPIRNRPSNWYLTGFLVPARTSEEHRNDPEADDEGNRDIGKAGTAEESADDGRSAKKTHFPSSLGLSFLVPEDAGEVRVEVRWGDYRREETEVLGETREAWARTPRSEVVSFSLSGEPEATREVPDSEGLVLHRVKRRLEDGPSAVSLFLVNQREPKQTRADEDIAWIFQTQLEVASPAGFLARPDRRGSDSGDLDARTAELHYRDTSSYATGHGVSADWDVTDGLCQAVRTEWIPRAEVERTETTPIPEVELSMDALAQAEDGAAAQRMMSPLVTRYRQWIEQQRGALTGASDETSEELLFVAEQAANRIEGGIHLLEQDPEALDAFRMANRAVALALRKRNEIATPRWRPFQLAFLLLNLPGLAGPDHPERKIADLLFFPTGGGKTEAYLGLAAFTMILRRLRNPEKSAGVSVIMRYTLRLLTFDQLHRAAGLVCALELLREKEPGTYGGAPFEIGLWVGKAATPNKMGKKGDGRRGTARERCLEFQQDSSKPSPIPIRSCPWCGTDFDRDSFTLEPNNDRPKTLRVVCLNDNCDFTRDRPLPIVAVDEPLYKQLPAFLIATVDKFASLPWVGDSGKLLGADPELLPPDLIIQDELHLISGPLGTMMGLYETAMDALSARGESRPKIVASTATASGAHDQIQAVFARARSEVFPPPGPDRRDSFFAHTEPGSDIARRYLGVAAPGRSAKVVMRRVLLALLSSAQRAYSDAGARKNPNNPADPYMTVLSYFNALRELGGARRIVEEEVQSPLARYGNERRRLNEPRKIFANREKLGQVVELTSRESADRVAMARERLGRRFHESGRVSCALATNMISVGLDVQRLGLMVVAGQPKTHAEYIQATSRIGRDRERPGLVVTILNIHKPRDQSHYERFRHYHETFYRAVESATVTPFAARALDRGLAAVLVALTRHSEPGMTPPTGAGRLPDPPAGPDSRLEGIFVERIREQPIRKPAEVVERIRATRSRIAEILDAWRKLQTLHAQSKHGFQYQKWEKSPEPVQWLLRDPLEDGLSPTAQTFRAARSLRDVEPETPILVCDQ